MAQVVPRSAEQMVRDLLSRAIRERVVRPAGRDYDDPDPQCRSSGELVGTANLLFLFLREAVSREREACARIVLGDEGRDDFPVCMDVRDLAAAIRDREKGCG